MSVGGFTKKMLAAVYDVKRGVMSNWLDKIGMPKPKSGGYYYTPAEVLQIYEKLGSPYDYE